MKQILIVLFSLVALVSCHSKQTPGVKEVPAGKSDSATSVLIDQISKKAIHPDSTLRTYSQFVAGMLHGGGPGISDKISNSSFYAKYSSTLDSNFKRIEKDRLGLMREWAKTELKDELVDHKVLFYPFSGPDILHAITFFPDAPEYVMVAMEPYGNLPKFNKMDSAQTNYYLQSVKETLQDIFDKSYFITRKMVSELQRQKVNGVTPLICLFLTRTGRQVVAITKNHLNNDGSISELAPDSMPGRTNDFIEIYFRDNDSAQLRKIVYFRANLGDEAFGGFPALPDNKVLQNYFNKLPEFYSYAKSASYLMNYKTFSAIRNICLNKSKSILQDDTGIGYQYFEPSKWKMKFYGHYAKPVSDFKGVYDAKLAEAYKKDSANVKPLAYSLGYHWGHQEQQNLMKAERK